MHRHSAARQSAGLHLTSHDEDGPAGQMDVHFIIPKHKTAADAAQHPARHTPQTNQTVPINNPHTQCAIFTSTRTVTVHVPT